jgi:hypothetical protein
MAWWPSKLFKNPMFDIILLIVASHEASKMEVGKDRENVQLHIYARQ